MSIPSGENVKVHQLSFHNPFLFYLKTTAKPRLSLKLMQISRYFCFKEFPYKVVEDLRYVHGEWKYFHLRKSTSQILDLDNITKPLWIINGFIFRYEANLLSQLLLKTAICDVKYLIVSGQCFRIQEFQFLISSKNVKRIYFNQTQIFFDDCSTVPIDEIVQMLPNLEEFSWNAVDTVLSTFTPTSTSKLIQYLNPSTLTQFELWGIRDTFDFKLFADFMDKNPSIYFRLTFNDPLSDDNTKILQAYVDNLIQTGEYKNRKILINFRQQNAEFYNILYDHLFY